MAAAIGIDLGTTNSCVGVFYKGSVEIIANDQGKRTTPSYVAFSDNDRLVGEPAKKQSAMNPKNTIFDAKRLIGRHFEDPEIQEDMKHWSFDVLNNEDKITLQAEHKGEMKTFVPEEISSMVLVKMKETAENFLGYLVEDAVITVPAYFNDSQRQATKDAGTIAGLNVLRIINEPTAAALAYGLQKDLKGERNVLIYDLGGGTFDVTILTITDSSQFNVRATSGDTHLGGEDFDMLVVKYLSEKFTKMHHKDLTGNARAMHRLRTAAAEAKHELSSLVVSSIDIDALFEGIDFRTKLYRATFEDICKDLFSRTLEPVKLALADAKMDKDSIDDVVLVGGSTRIPKVQEILKNFFSGKELNLSVHPDEAVAYGAAILASMLSDPTNRVVQEVVLFDVCSLSLGIEILGGEMTTIIERNTKVPCKRIRVFTNSVDFETSTTISVFEGECNLIKDNNFLGKFVLSGIPAAAAGTVVLDVSFELDENGILKVCAEERSTGSSEQVTIRRGKRNLTSEDIKKMSSNAENYKSEDQRKTERNIARNSVEWFINHVKTEFGDAEHVFRREDLERVNVICEETTKQLDACPETSTDEYQKKLKEVASKIEQIIGQPIVKQRPVPKPRSKPEEENLTNLKPTVLNVSRNN